MYPLSETMERWPPVRPTRERLNLEVVWILVAAFASADGCAFVRFDGGSKCLPELFGADGEPSASRALGDLPQVGGARWGDASLGAENHELCLAGESVLALDERA